MILALIINLGKVLNPLSILFLNHISNSIMIQMIWSQAIKMITPRKSYLLNNQEYKKNTWRLISLFKLIANINNAMWSKLIFLFLDFLWLDNRIHNNNNHIITSLEGLMVVLPTRKNIYLILYRNQNNQRKQKITSHQQEKLVSSNLNI